MGRFDYVEHENKSTKLARFLLVGTATLFSYVLGMLLFESVHIPKCGTC